MRNLYEILGLSSSATSLQIEQAYRVRLHALKDSQRLLSEAENLELRAVEEAYSVLSSPSRKERYDQKLAALNRPVQYEVVEAHPTPWLKIILISAALLFGGIYWYNSQQNKARIEQLKIEEAKAKAEADKAEKLAEAEKAVAESERIRAQQIAEQNSRREMEQARYLGQRAHLETQHVEASRQRAIELEERQAKLAQMREEQAARARIQQQNAAMERALNRPVGGASSPRPNVTVISNDPVGKEEPRTTTPYGRYPR